ncbi:MAG: chemotaxis-specific protein-glutamate methyltransferase CheB [Oscillospiraceae bacterium]|nr:chemotaxis-specific protein-glutamate methyltransferase CheB [Oscillospiraceae bacterium]
MLEKPKGRSRKLVKVLVVDDSLVFAELLRKRLSEFNEITVVGTASDPYQARDKILELEPDVMTLDFEMPRMDGIRFLKKLLPQYPLPVIMITSLEEKVREAPSAGAAGAHVKPDVSEPERVSAFINAVASDIIRLGPKNAASAHPGVTHSELPVSRRSEPAQNMPIPSGNTVDIVALGASTGGTDALEVVVKKLPKNCPPVIITQHMPPVFTKMYAERLNRSSALAVFEAADGMRLKKGMCVIAAGGFHMELRKDARGYYISSHEGEKVSGHCPSVDVMFTSVAECAGKHSVAALLTGMGADGAKGLLKIRRAGGYTIGQNKETCVVYGMPMEAYKMGAVCEEAPIENISGIIMKRITNSERN